MKKILLFLAVMIAGLGFSATPCAAQIQNPAKWTYTAQNEPGGNVTLIMTVKLESGWHIYSQNTDPNGPIGLEFTFEESPNYVRLGNVREPKPHEAYDETFNCMVRSFDGSVTFRQTIKRNTKEPFVVKGSMYYQLCNEGSCIAPDDVVFEINVPEAVTDAAAETIEVTEEYPVLDIDDTLDQATVDTSDTIAAAVDTVETNTATIAEAEENSTSEKNEGLLIIFFGALLGGILTMFTPCVFPMIPMTVNFFMHGSDNKSNNRRQAWFFGFSIVFMFAVLGGVISLFFGPEALNFIGTHGIPNLIFFAIFIIFSLSFFGLFEIRMPEKWINKSDEQAEKGGLLGPFFIALTTVLISFSCTGPIIGGALVGFATSTANRWVSLVTMLGFGIGFALPFTLLAMFPSVLKNMKSGSWLNSVKIVFAFLELAFGLKFLSMADQYYTWRLLDREIYLALWIVIFTLTGLYLLGKLKFKGDDDVEHIGVVRLFLSIGIFSFVVYMIPGLWGAPLNGISGFLPPMDTQDFNVEKIVIDNSKQLPAGTVEYTGALPADRKYADKLHMPTGFEGFYDLDEAKAYAQKVGKPIFIDFTGRNCANCREMEQAVWTHPEAKKLLNNEFVMVALYADMNAIELPEDEWVEDDNGRVLKTLGRKNLYFQTKNYNMNAQPYYVIIDAEGNTLTQENFKYEKDAEKFVAFLNEGVNNFKK